MVTAGVRKGCPNLHRCTTSSTAVLFSPVAFSTSSSFSPSSPIWKAGLIWALVGLVPAAPCPGVNSSFPEECPPQPTPELSSKNPLFLLFVDVPVPNSASADPPKPRDLAHKQEKKQKQPRRITMAMRGNTIMANESN